MVALQKPIAPVTKKRARDLSRENPQFFSVSSPSGRATPAPNDASTETAAQLITARWWPGDMQTLPEERQFDF